MKQPTKKPSAKPAEHRRHIYMKQPIWDAMAALCEKRGEKVSSVLTKKAEAYIRLHAPLLRKHGIPIPEEVFAK